MIKKLLLYFHTIRNLKAIQIWYQLYYIFLNQVFRKPLDLTQDCNETVKFLDYSIATTNNSFKGNNAFTFLNITHDFQKQIDWEYMDYGKLWQYNLAYFDFLSDESISKEEGLNLIYDFIENQNKLKSSNEPYPISLRLINWIRFVSKYQTQDKQIINAIYAQANHLINRLEYHLLGNHLLENAFALLHVAKFFNSKKNYEKAKSILIEQLNEQILSDGGHFEQSPMYHQIIFYRVLETIDLLKNNLEVDNKDNFQHFLEEIAQKMLSWLEEITFKNGKIPLLNDSAEGIAMSTSKLKAISQKINITSSEIKLSNSGYRKIQKENYEVIVDIGNVTATYQPAHTHADIFNFVLNYDNKPMIVDTGISTYNNNDRRYLERSTISHNTVTFNNNNQYRIWSSFRVARRAIVKVILDNNLYITAVHDGYKRWGILHQRSFIFEESKKIIIEDIMIGGKGIFSKHLHFHPDLQISVQNNSIEIENCKIVFENSIKLNKEVYYFASEFNKTMIANKVIITFEKTLKTQIVFN